MLLKSCIICSCTPLVRKECLEMVGGFDDLPSAQDWDLWIRIAKQYEFEYIDDILCTYHSHGTQISANMQKRLQGRTNIVEKYGHDMPVGTPAYHYHWLGVNHFLYGSKKMATHYERIAHKLDPRNIKYVMTLVSFLFGQWAVRNYLRITHNLYEL